MKKDKILKNVVQLLGIMVGAVLFGIGYSWFLVPYKIAPGGVGGLAQIFYHIFHIPVGISMIVMNIPLFLLGLWILGKRFGARTLYGFFIVGFFTDLLSLPSLHKLGLIKDLSKYTFLHDGEKIYSMISPDNIYLAAVAGSVLLGMGLGLIFRFKGSTGGTDIPVAILKQKTGISIGTGYWIVETFIILTVALVFKDIKLVIWGYINLFISAKITDLTSEGLPYVKGVYVSSPKYEEIKKEILSRLNRGVTLFRAKGGYTNEDQYILFCVMNRRQVPYFKEIVKEIDPKAFVILTDVYDVMGYGFKTRNIDFQED